jgi:hypothetical protein
MTKGNPRTKRHMVLFSVLFLLVVGGIAGALLFRVWCRYYDSLWSSSCANHFIQLQVSLEMIAEGHQDLVLPQTADTRKALLYIFKMGEPSPDWREEWLQIYGSACPESFRRSGSIGYVYVGDDLKLGDVSEKGVLVLFCPGENHRGSSDHCHAWSNGICKSNAEMIEELRNAIARGESGEVSYSSRAIAVLREELQKRLTPK